MRRVRVFLGRSKPTRQWDIAMFLLSDPRQVLEDWFDPAVRVKLHLENPPRSAI